MAKTMDIAGVRRAFRELELAIEVIEPDRPLKTSQIIALYFWLIDHEVLKGVQPVNQAIERLLACLERQVVRKTDHVRIQWLCRKFGRASGTSDDGSAAGDRANRPARKMAPLEEVR